MKEEQKIYTKSFDNSNYQKLLKSQYNKYFLQYSQKDKQWSVYQNFKNQKQFIKPKKVQRLKIMTLNVLFDTRKVNERSGFIEKKHIKYSLQRYEYILRQVFDVMKPDVIVFNQVCKIFYQNLKQKQNVRKNYLISPCQYNPFTKFDVLGNIIMVKKQLPSICLHLYKVPDLDQPIPIAFIQINKMLMSFSSVHLLAYQKNIQPRKKQLNYLCQYLNHFQNMIYQYLLGDMNFHHQSEQKTIEQLQLIDVWAQLHDIKAQPGYTFDAQQNLMINQLYWGFQQRRMRLDRILVKQNETIKQEKRLNLKTCDIIFNKPIFIQKMQTQFHGWYKSLTSFAFDLIGKNIHREKQDYLFPSDHFGLLAEIQLN